MELEIEIIDPEAIIKAIGPEKIAQRLASALAAKVQSTSPGSESSDRLTVKFHNQQDTASKSSAIYGQKPYTGAFGEQWSASGEDAV